MPPAPSVFNLSIIGASLCVLGVALLPARSANPELQTNSATASSAPATNIAAEMSPRISEESSPDAKVAATNSVLETFPTISGTSTPQAKSGAPALATASAAGKAPKFTWSSVKVDGPYIAMTFDDGPNPKNTPKLLDLLAAKHIKATFFVVGECATDYPAIMKRIIAEGHEIGNHSWDHPNFGKSSDDKIRSQVQRTNDIILAETGIKPTLLRPPYGSMTPKQRQWVHDEFGYDIILWDVDPNDWKEPGVNVVAQRIISGTRPGSIILSHDIHAPTIKAMPMVFDALLAKGFKFVTVSELIAMDKGSAKPNNSMPAPAYGEPETSSSTNTPSARAPFSPTTKP
jgi:peptidoglycan/xylan/chitin deacetylase (PgdA/CDA1 family)